jgi:8-oxo-dGTP pyrophosphatase MutT (NUDIX family)
MQQLNATKNRFGGMLIHADGLPNTPGDFERLLQDALAAWRQEAIKVVWLEIPSDKSDLIPVAVALGFQFHHCEGNHLLLITPLIENAFIFPDASHYVGAGAVVLSDENDLLVVKERHRNPKYSKFYKLPGGLVDEGEHIVDAAIREVREETGIEAEFEALTCFRHIHHLNFGKSNLYFICRMRPLTYDITIDEGEIEEAFWMPVEEFLVHERVHAFNRRIVEASLTHKTLTPVIIEGDHRPPNETEIFLPV